MPAWLEYAYKDTPLHKLHPFTKVALTVSLLMLIGFYWDIRFMLPIALTALILVLIAGVPKSWLYAAGGIMIALIPITLIGIVTQVNPDLFKVYPREFIMSLSFTFTIPYLGSFGLTWGGVLWGLANEIRIPVVLFLVYSFLYSTSISDLIQALSKTRLPNSLIFVIMVAYKFVPEMWRKLRTITTALRLRGWAVKSRNPVKLVKRMTPLAYSMVRQVTVTIDEVNLASKLRGFGAGRIAPTRELKMKAKDLVITVGSLTFFGIAMFFLIVYNVGLI